MSGGGVLGGGGGGGGGMGRGGYQGVVLSSVLQSSSKISKCLLHNTSGIIV